MSIAQKIENGWVGWRGRTPVTTNNYELDEKSKVNDEISIGK